MLLEAALALEIQRSNPRTLERDARFYAGLVAEEARRRTLDPWVFHAIIHVETRWTPRVIAHERNGSCSVGFGGINTRCDSEEALRLLDPLTNIRRMGEILQRLRSSCAHCAGLTWIRRYNPGNPRYVSSLIGPLVERCHAAYEPSVWRVPPRVHVPRMPREGAH